MKENSDNKSLIRVNDNIFSKIRNWFINLFSAKINNIKNCAEEIILKELIYI